MVMDCVVLLGLVATQASPPPAAKPLAQVNKPQPVQAYSMVVDIQATAPALKTPEKAAPEAEAVMGKLKSVTKLQSRFLLTLDTSRQEILSTDFALPAGTLVYHKAGDNRYVVADPPTKTYAVLDSATLLNTLEGSAGIENSQYQVKVQHVPGEKKTIAGYECRKSVVTVTYASSIPLENDRVLVQQKNDVVVWHTAQLVSSAAMDHLFFKFQRDRTGAIQKALATEIGFPMEVSFTVTQGSGPKGATPQPGSFHWTVTEVKGEKLDPATFILPPAGYKKVEKNPFASSS